MANKIKFTQDTVKHIAQLADIPVTSSEEEKLAQGFNTTIEVIEKLNELDTNQIEPTHQVTGLTNVFREDEIDEKRMLSQEEALQNAKNTYKGYFVVDQILDGD